MWAVIKSNPKFLELMKKDIANKLSGETKFYSPKILVQYYLKNKLRKKEINLLGDYIFCYNENLKGVNLNIIKFSRGVKYYLQGHEILQENIVTFINKCKKNENEKGYVTLNFFELYKNTKYKFASGPFANKIFEIINFQKNKIDILIGKFKTTVNKQDFVFRPI